MADRRRSPTALLLCDESTLLAQVVRQTARDYGFQVLAVVRRWVEAVELTADRRPDVVIVELALAGQAGLPLVSALRAIAPESDVIVVLPGGVMDLDALEMQALAVVDPSDLRPLGRALRGVAERHSHVG